MDVKSVPYESDGFLPDIQPRSAGDTALVTEQLVQIR